MRFTFRGKNKMNKQQQLSLRNPLLALLFLTFVTLPASSWCQNVIIDPPLVIPVNTLSISDIDFSNATSPKLWVSIGMRTSDNSTVDVNMTFHLDILLAGGERLPNAMVGQTKKKFTISRQRTVTNLDIGKEKLIDTQIDFDPAAKRRLQEIALPSGLLPAGRYEFSIEVTPVSGGPGANNAFALVLTNPSSIQPVFPFDGDQSVSRFPLFQWRYEGRARISIFEKLPNQSSIEEAAAGVPLLTEVTQTQSFQYPLTGTRQLLPGKTYVWYVEGLALTSGISDVVQKSDLRWFTVAPEGSTENSSSALLDELERSLPAKFKPVFDQIKAQGLLPDGPMRKNGGVISDSEFRKLLSQFRRNPETVSSVGLE
jgi:hypothetical protein